MPSKQIEYDIEKRILDKLSLWLNDSIALCEMADIRKSTAVAIVMRGLLWCLISGLIQKGSSKADFLEIAATNWDIVMAAKPKLESDGRL